jgi:ADP-heptose:LPS heptosyltransferase
MEAARESGPAHQNITGVEILKSMGIESDPNAIALKLPPAEIEWAREWVRSNLPAGKPIVWLHLSNRRPKSRWPAGRFKQLAARLIEKTGACVVLARSAGDIDVPPSAFEPLAKERVAWFENDSFAKFAAALGQSKVVVCGDGGVMHLAAALGVRVVALFSATEPEIWRPWGDQHTVLRNGDDVSNITIDEVFKAVAKSLS